MIRFETDSPTELGSPFGRLAALADRLGVDLRVEPAIAHVRLNVPDGGPSELVVSEDAAGAAWLPAAAALLHVAELGWAGTRWTFRFPLPGDDLAMREAIARQRRTFRAPYRAGLRTLMPDDWLAAVEREGRSAADVAAEAGVGVADLEARMREWRSRQSGQPRPAVADLREHLRRGQLQHMGIAQPLDFALCLAQREAQQSVLRHWGPLADDLGVKIFVATILPGASTLEVWRPPVVAARGRGGFLHVAASLSPADRDEAIAAGIAVIVQRRAEHIAASGL